MAHSGANVGDRRPAGESGGQRVSRLVLIIVSLVAGTVVAVGATFATTSVVNNSPTPSNQPAYNYGAG